MQAVPTRPQQKCRGPPAHEDQREHLKGQIRPKLAPANAADSSGSRLQALVSRTWHSDGPFLALQSCTGHRGFADTSHVHRTHLELVEDVLLQVLSLEEAKKHDENQTDKQQTQFDFEVVIEGQELAL